MMFQRREKRTIINFHGIGEPVRPYEPGEEPYWISIDHFEEILHVIDQDAFRHKTLITFDDGNSSDLEIAMPRLLDRNLKASFFVLAGKLKTQGYLSADNVQILLQNKMEIGSHGLDHVDWTAQSADDLTREIIFAREELQQVCNRPIRKAAIPFGKYNRRVLNKLREASFDTVYTSDGGSSDLSWWLQSRTSVTKNTSINEIEMLLKHGIGKIKEINRDAKMFLKGLR